MRWLILFLVLSSCAGQHSFPTYENFRKPCIQNYIVHWSNCEDKFKAMEDIYERNIDLWQYKRTF